MREVETIKKINLKTENLKIVSIPSGVRRLQTSEPSKNPLLPTLHSSETDIHLSVTTRAKLTTPFDYLRSYSTVAHENGSESIERKFDPKNHAVVKSEKVMVLLVR